MTNRDADELREYIEQLDREIEAWDRWTDKHLYPSGMEKLRRLRNHRDQLARRVAVLSANTDRRSPA